MIIQDIFAQHLALSRQRLEELWQQANQLPKESEQSWQLTPERVVHPQTLLMQSLEEFSKAIEELQVATEELYQQTDELVASRWLLEGERQRYQEFLELAPFGYLITTKEGTIRETNPVAARLLNVPQQRVVGKPLIVFIAPEQRREFYAQLHELPPGESNRQWQVWIQPRHGVCLKALCTISPLQDAQNQILGWHWCIQDLSVLEKTITQQQQESLNVSDATLSEDSVFRAMFESAAVGIALLENDGHLFKSNPSVQQMLGCSEEQLQKIIPQWIAGDESGQESTLFQQLIAGQCHSYQLEKRFCREHREYGIDREGEEENSNLCHSLRWLRLTVSRVQRSQGEPHFVTCVLEDITELRQQDATQKLETQPGEKITQEQACASDALIKSSTLQLTPEGESLTPEAKVAPTTAIAALEPIKAKATASVILTQEAKISTLQSHVASVVCSELRHPLNNIVCCAKLIESYSQRWSEEKKRDYLQQIQVHAKHINHLLEDLSLIGKLEAGKHRLNPALIDITEFCRELIAKLQKGKGCRHQLTLISRGSRSGIWDEKLLRRILNNLLLNAIHYSPEGSEIKLEVDCQESSVGFTIQDSGIGIPLEEEELIFQAFHRGSNVGTVRGSGLGLTVVKECVKLQKGEIFLESQVGIGTTVTVKLPLDLRSN
jgi:PAS domain S-box-containing protein